jgi:uncharacterized protein (DUF433 family)
MSRINWQSFISIDPEIHHGEPCIKGTRISVAIIIGSIADGMSMDDIIKEYPQIKRESIQAALAYAAEAVRTEIILPLPG